MRTCINTCAYTKKHIDGVYRYSSKCFYPLYTCMYNMYIYICMDAYVYVCI